MSAAASFVPMTVVKRLVALCDDECLDERARHALVSVIFSERVPAADVDTGALPELLRLAVDCLNGLEDAAAVERQAAVCLRRSSL